MSDALPHEQEAASVNTIRVIAFVGGFIVFAILLGLGLSIFYRGVMGRTVLDARPQDFPLPALQPDPSRDLARLQDEQSRQLDRFAWVDKDKAIAHVPIAEAMKIVAARGDRGFDPVPLEQGGDEGAPVDGAPRAKPSLRSAPYGVAP